MWYVYVVIIAMLPSADGKEPSFIQGDIIHSTTFGASDTLDKCEEAGSISTKYFDEVGKGSSKSVFVCVELPAEFAHVQGWTPTDSVNP